jgi:glycosyltransferase involved in cell wall biosynthesis
MLHAGHQVIAHILLPPAGVPNDAAHGRNLEALRQRGAQAEVFHYRLPEPAKVKGLHLPNVKRLLFPLWEEMFPAATLGPILKEALIRTKPDAALVFYYGAMAALADFAAIPRMAIFDDPPHLVRRFRLRYQARPSLSRSYLRRLLAQASYELRIPRLMVRYASRYESTGWFAAHHAAWARRQGLNCTYYPHPVADLAGPGWKTQRRAAPKPMKPKILLLGNVQNTASILGLRMLAQKVLPGLDLRLGRNGYEVHIVGSGTMQPEIRGILQHPAVKLRGFVDDAALEFYTSHIYLSPITYPVGSRTRILAGMPYGSCIVAHSAAALATPELVHGENCLLAPKVEDLPRLIEAAIRDDEMRVEMEQRARAAFELHFAPEVAAARIVKELEMLALKRKNGIVQAAH